MAASKEKVKQECYNFYISAGADCSVNPRTYEGGGGWMSTPLKVILSFFLEDKASAPDVFSSCSFIPPAKFEASSVIVSCYGYEV